MRLRSAALCVNVAEIAEPTQASIVELRQGEKESIGSAAVSVVASLRTCTINGAVPMT